MTPLSSTIYCSSMDPHQTGIRILPRHLSYPERLEAFENYVSLPCFQYVTYKEQAITCRGGPKPQRVDDGLPHQLTTACEKTGL